MQISYSRGHKIYYDGNVWRYTDNNEKLNKMRSCKKCGQIPTKEGYDACLGKLNEVKSACCGHGIEKKYIIKKSKKYGDKTN